MIPTSIVHFSLLYETRASQMLQKATGSLLVDRASTAGTIWSFLRNGYALLLQIGLTSAMRQLSAYASPQSFLL